MTNERQLSNTPDFLAAHMLVEIGDRESLQLAGRFTTWNDGDRGDAFQIINQHYDYNIVDRLYVAKA